MSGNTSPQEPKPTASFVTGLFNKIKAKLSPALAAWIVVAGLVVILAVFGLRRIGNREAAINEPPPAVDLSGEDVVLPLFEVNPLAQTIPREAVYDTVVPRRSRVETISYTVTFGDSVFGIADDFDITPETLLWANFAVLDDNPDFLEPGMELNIPPTDGVYYQWQVGDTLKSVARELQANVDEIINWVGNHLDLVNPAIEPGKYVMVPGGQREFRQWIIPVIPRSSAGVSRSLYGSGACEGNYDGAFGTGTFIWPSTIHEVVGNDYWSGHLALDIAIGEGMPILAADSGVVTFSGWATGGYGYMVMLDHGNGYSTLYAHMSQTAVECGASIVQGMAVGYGGSTGNSTGPHLHFEVRFQGGFINPWFALPAP